MVDRFTPETRSRMMSAIRGRDTKPELVVRKILRELGVGYRLHRKDLPGKPDISMSGRRKIIEVRGCFWHRHPGCRFAYEPKSRQEFWTRKFASNVERDERNDRALRDRGWQVLTIWECETAQGTSLQERVAEFVGAGEHGAPSKGRDHSRKADETPAG
ncbi:Very short patch repair protein [Methylobacterium tardum]|uniref:Very short patch repair endonuclease n=1 Tax=Methylobacterium tardum TaxID=374432 RepID=A0AA37WQ41_9HYPH|nr:very short patch repair endonuclease [Methylobacterium tardum]URD38752.1 very short patch repair endonuclease [Methylobacterium tardum]GJE53069.1 Very short patch repair protein [Methylobacterium tardum]GLS68726.1 very short patch repair endonuclease [Methylobacterium tardum]